MVLSLFLASFGIVGYRRLLYLLNSRYPEAVAPGQSHAWPVRYFVGNGPEVFDVTASNLGPDDGSQQQTLLKQILGPHAVALFYDFAVAAVSGQSLSSDDAGTELLLRSVMNQHPAMPHEGDSWLKPTF